MPNENLVLIVEDDEDDVFFLHRAFQKAGIVNPIQVVSTGRDAMAYLAGTDPYSDWEKFPLPSMVLLDLKLPDLTGFDVLKWIRKSPGLQNLRVSILTGACAAKDIKMAYELRANGFISKEANYSHLLEIMRAFRMHWLESSRAPEASRTP